MNVFDHLQVRERENSIAPAAAFSFCTLRSYEGKTSTAR